MRIDEQVVHAEDIQAGSGTEFYGTPIREMCLFDVDIREQDDMQKRVRASLGVEFPPVEVLPGETIKDDVIRRKTTAEVVGESFHEASLHETADNLYFDLDLPRVHGGWKTSAVFDIFGKIVKHAEFFQEAPERLRRTFKGGVWYSAKGKVVQL